MMVSATLGPGGPDQVVSKALEAAAHSRFVQRIRRRYHAELALLPPGPPTAAAMRQTLAALQAGGLDTPAALRVLRHLVLERLAVLDVEHGAPLALVTGAMTDLAELALEHQMAQHPQGRGCVQARRLQRRQRLTHGSCRGRPRGQQRQLGVVAAPDALHEERVGRGFESF